MTPGLAFFYGGMVRGKNVLNMLMMNFITIGLVGVLWVLVGYTLAFGDGGRASSATSALRSWRPQQPSRPRARGCTIPVAGLRRCSRRCSPSSPRPCSPAPSPTAIKFGPFIAIIVLWSLLVYSPVAHWVLGAERLAVQARRVRTSPVAPSSTPTPVPPVWLSPSCSASARAGRRSRCGRTTCRSSCSAPACCGSAGSASTPAPRSGANGLAALAFINDEHRDRRGDARLGPRRRRSATVTRRRSAPPPARSPAWSPSPRPAAFVSPLGSIVLGLDRRCGLRLATGLKFKFGYDDALDVVGVHLVGGVARRAARRLPRHRASRPPAPRPDGLFYGGGFTQLGKQAAAVGRRRWCTRSS